MSRKRLRGLIQVAVSAILLAFILHQVDWNEVRDSLLRIDLRWLALAWALFLLGVFVRAARWQVLLNALGVRRPFPELATWYFVGGFFNVVLPTGFGGDAVRVAELGQDISRYDVALNSVLVDRYLGLMVLLAMGLLAAPFSPESSPAGVFWLTASLFAAGVAGAWLLRRAWWPALAERQDGVGAVVRVLRLPGLAASIRPYDRWAIVLGIFISLVFNLLQIGWNVAIARGLGLDLPLTMFLVFVPLTAVALLLPAFGGLGVRELTYIGLFGSIGVPQAIALALSLGVYAITVCTGLVGGLLYLTGGIRRARSKEANPVHGEASHGP